MRLNMIWCLVLLLFFGCVAREEGISFYKDSIEGNKTTWIKPEPGGHWKLVKTSIVKDIPFVNIYYDPDAYETAMESDPFEYYRKGDLVFENDTLYQINYPIDVIDKAAYTIDTGYLYSENEDRSSFYPVEMKNDTLIRYVRGSYGPEYLKEEYVKTVFDDSIITLLKKHKVNFPGLAGRWILKRDYWYDYGTHYWLEFPHQIPDSIEISREQFGTLQKQNLVYQMLTDGRKRDYVIWYRHPYLHLSPGSWYKGEDPWIHFEKRETN